MKDNYFLALIVPILSLVWNMNKSRPKINIHNADFSLWNNKQLVFTAILRNVGDTDMTLRSVSILFMNKGLVWINTPVHKTLPKNRQYKGFRSVAFSVDQMYEKRIELKKHTDTEVEIVVSDIDLLVLNNISKVYITLDTTFGDFRKTLPFSFSSIDLHPVKKSKGRRTL